MTTKRSVALHHRMGTHGLPNGRGGSIHARMVSCGDCDWHTARMDADDACPRCGGALYVGTSGRAKAMTKRRPQSCGIVGERSPIEEAETNRLLAEAREAAGR